MGDLINLKLIDPFIVRKLLEDKTTGKNIIWATDSYSYLGSGYERDKQILFDQIINTNIIEPRIQKDAEVQKERTKKNAEVFTPSWICNKMNNCIDNDWFEEKSVFNVETENDWSVKLNNIAFSKKNNWKKYVNQKILEITCGEAPFLASRYDSSTGEKINIKDRIGVLDRKLRVITENTATYEEWFKWAIKALKSVYGYEFQGDSLLIGRINIYLTLIETMEEVWHQQPTLKQIIQILETITWNIWQMDGLTDCIPIGVPEDRFQQATLFDFFDECQVITEQSSQPVRIKWWDNKEKIILKAMKEGKYMGKRKWDVVIGNPPYQENIAGTSDKPVYNLFLDAASKISKSYIMITPARFLFNAGKTPKSWNEKMLHNDHFKVIDYIQKSSEVFQNTDIKGGVAISYYSEDKKFEPIVVFTPYKILNNVRIKVMKHSKSSLADIIFAPESYRFMPKIHSDFPNLKYVDGNRGILSKGHDFDLTTNILDKLDGIVFHDSNERDNRSIAIYGRKNGKRHTSFISKEYIADHPNLTKWKVFIPKANGSGQLGETLSTPVIGEPFTGHTQSFISIGSFSSKNEAENLLKFIKTKFARTMLSILKITQDNKKSVWKFVPMQDFSPNSDIDWSKSISDIDQQLYKKYNLSPDEINFIETHVKEMK